MVTRSQAEQLQRADGVFRARLDTLWTGLATYLAALGDSYDEGGALARVDSATDAGWAMTQREAPVIRAIVTQLQWSMLPRFAATVLNAKEPLKIRMSSVR